MRTPSTRCRKLFLEPLERRLMLSFANLFPDLTVDEDAENSVLDLGAVFRDAELGLGDALTYTAALSMPIDNLVEQVNQANYTNLHQDLLYTHTGNSRGITGSEHDLARNNIQAYFGALGLQTSLEQFAFDGTMYCNVVGVHRGVTRPDDVYLVGAHYDSVNCPGADDNASGTAAVMELARVLSQYSFDATLVFVAFDREEQGLYGSGAYATAHASDHIRGMLSLDMIAYNPDGATHDTVRFYDAVAGGQVKPDLAAAFAAYGRGLATVDSGLEDGSDHYYFEQRGFDAALVIEYGVFSNPNYHRAGDAVESADYIDYAYATKVTCGTLGYLATAAGLQSSSALLTAAVSGENLVLDYAPDANGIVDVRVRATDAQGRWIEDTVRVTVRPVADPPTLDPLSDMHVAADSPSVDVTLTGVLSQDGTAQPLRVTAVSNAPAIVASPAVTYFSPAAGGTVRIAPVAGAHGVAVITVTVEDGGADNDLDTPADNMTVSRAFTVNVSAEQHRPTANADQYFGVEGQTLTVSGPGVLQNDVDADGDTLHAVLVTSVSHGVLQLRSDGGFTYTPATKFNREDVFTYVASDGGSESPYVTVVIVLSTAYPWYNGIEPLDVNDDAAVTPLDALLIINALNRGEAGGLPTSRPRPLPAPFLDVSRDGGLRPLDALLVINYLNRGDGEGEAGDTVAHATTATTTGTTGHWWAGQWWADCVRRLRRRTAPTQSTLGVLAGPADPGRRCAGPGLV